MADRKNGLGATHTTIANNIIQGGGQAADFNGPNTNTTWKGNIVWETAGIGAIPSEGYKPVDPRLSKGTSIICQVQAGSPAIDAGIGSYSYVKEDIDGQPRSQSPDIGADEFSEEKTINKPLTVADVGPAANPTY